MTSRRADLLSTLFAGTPAFRGKWWLADTLGKIASQREDGRGRCSPWPATRLEVNLSDRIERLMWGGCYELHVRRCLEAVLRTSDTFVDVGAHIGYHTVVGAALVGREGRVFAFEPDPDLHRRLAHHLESTPWACAVPFAVWERSGTILFERSPQRGESGWGTLTTVRDLGKGEHIAVQAVSLDDWCKTCPLHRLRAIKIDAEGCELGILKGAQKLIQYFRPAIVLEMNDPLLREAGTSAAAMAAHLLSLDYKLFGLSWLRLEPLAEGQLPRTSEVLCIPGEQVEAKLESLGRAGFKS